MFVPFPKELVPVRIVRRLNRFTIEVWPDHECEQDVPLRLHLPNSGRMQELLVPSAQGLAVFDGGGERKTAGTLLLVHYGGRWVSVDARMPNRLFEAGMKSGSYPPFSDYSRWRSEVSWGRGRIDFRLSVPGASDFLVETKSCNLVEDGLALFPDAPTERGARHLTELAEAVEAGLRAAVVWFVQRDDALRLAAHRDADPAFAQALDAARAVGVETYAYRCRVDPSGVEVVGEIPVIH